MDSDRDSGEDGIVFSHTAKATASPRNSQASRHTTLAAQPFKTFENSVPPGSASEASSRPPTSTLHARALASSATAASNRPSAATSAPSMDPRAAAANGYIHPQEPTTDDRESIERDAKRRKVLSSDRQEDGDRDIQVQQYHGIREYASTLGGNTLTQVQGSPVASCNTHMHAPFNDKNGAPSVHCIKSAPDPPARSLPLQRGALSQPLLAQLHVQSPQEAAITALPSPGLPTPESVSPKVTHLDSLQDNKIESAQEHSRHKLTPPSVSATNTMPPKTSTTSASQKADHLLIFLKEVKKFKWADITKEFAKDIPGRSYVQLQSRYSQTLNKRDRSQDPSRLNLPPRFATEATIDWVTVHANTAGPRVPKDLAVNGSLKNQHIGKTHIVHQSRDEDSSGTDSAPQRQRSRRAAAVNYAWPMWRDTENGTGESIDEGDVHYGLYPSAEQHTHSDSLMERTLVTSSATLAPRPLDMEFWSNDAKIGLASPRDRHSVQQERAPYMSSPQRSSLCDRSERWVWEQEIMQGWQGAVLHVDFSSAELQMVERVVASVVPPKRQIRHSTYRRRLRASLKDLAEPQFKRLAHELGRHLRSRDAQSIRSFLDDAAAGKVPDMPHIQRLAMAKPRSRVSREQLPVPSVLRQRELGLQSRRGWHAAATQLTYQLKNQLMDTLGPKSTWTGASSDINTVAWSPNGQYFAAGAVAVTDTESMQYNRPNVLMYGDTINGNIHELGEHYEARPKTDAGANSTHAMYVSQDPKLYTTVSSVAFSQSGSLMYSAGYDKTVCIWDVTTGSVQPQMARQLEHKAEVDILAVNQNFDGVIATASKRTTHKSIKLVFFDEETIHDEDRELQFANFASSKATNRPDLKMSPNALKFDPDGRFLLAGFGANIREDSGFDTSGDICLWDVAAQAPLQLHGSSRNVFDVAFNPAPRFQSLFAVGCVANGQVNRGTRSVVRFYAMKGTAGNSGLKYTCPLELECKAFDMNDVVWCPHNENLIAAGCTDGRSYVWDLRRPDILLYTLPHGSSLMPLQDDVPHERTDTGVRFLSWGQNTTRLYSGSSDGVVKIWDVTQSLEDVHVKDLITTNSGIMSGAFTDDCSKLLLGEVNGTVDVLEIGRDDIALKDADKLQYYPYCDEDDEDNEETSIPSFTPQTAAAEARAWVETGRLRLAQMGGLPKQQVIQGPNYNGPFDRSGDAYSQSLREQAFNLQRHMAMKNEPECDLAGCANSVNTTTSEEVGDSGRSKDRIPDELRRQWLDEAARIVPGRSQCANCHRPAFPSTGADSAALCERCSFMCFRCGAASNITGHTVTLDCNACGAAWDVGSLGYECIQNPRITATSADIPALKKFGKEAYLERLEDADTTFGDEMNALSDYYFGLAIDRPESSPL